MTGYLLNEMKGPAVYAGRLAQLLSFDKDINSDLDISVDSSS